MTKSRFSLLVINPEDSYRKLRPEKNVDLTDTAKLSHSPRRYDCPLVTELVYRGAY